MDNELAVVSITWRPFSIRSIWVNSSNLTALLSWLGSAEYTPSTPFLPIKIASALISAARNAAGAAEGSALARLSESQLGKVVATFTDAQFSQKQEYEADEHGFEFCVKHGFDPYGMANSLDKLVELSKGAKASTVQKMFSSHPDSEKRAARMKEKADAYMAAQRQNR